MVITGWKRLIVLGLGGFAIGTILSGSIAAESKGSWYTLRTQVVTYPAAYELPKMPGGTPLRMAMIHDVLLERYLHHGSAWYEKGVADAKKTVDAERGKPGAPSMAMLEAMDDEAVGLENLHKSDEAAAVMREKLKIMPILNVKIPRFTAAESDTDIWEVEQIKLAIKTAAALTPEMRQQYTARANLGTSLIHGNFAQMMAGDEAARARMEEGVRYIDEAMAINPGAHFGRETWQAIVVRHFLACRQNSSLMLRFDMIGDELANVTEDDIQRKIAYLRYSGLKSPAEWLDAHATIGERIEMRAQIPRVGVALEWAGAIRAGIATPAHFDEPTLALMGMWMLGGGPNPHSAMALANIALQVGQREIAWDGFERAVELQEGFSPDAKVRDALVAYCRRQQSAIAAMVVSKGEATDAGAWQGAARQRHAAELAWALQYRDQYQAWEAKQIAAGMALEDANFYAGFFKNHPSIASPVGHADESATRFFVPDGVLDGLPVGLAVGGVFMLLGALTAKRAGP